MVPRKLLNTPIFVNDNCSGISSVRRDHLRTSRQNYGTSRAWKLTVWNVLLYVFVNFDEALLQPMHDLLMRVCFLVWILRVEERFLSWAQLFAIIFLDLRGERHFDEATYLSAKLPMAIANAEQVQGGQPLYVWSQDVLILIDFVGVVGVVPHSSGECELANTILTFFVELLLSCCLLLITLSLVLERRRPSWWIVRLRQLFAHYDLLHVRGLKRIWLLS